jgi:hypothetical protein
MLMKHTQVSREGVVTDPVSRGLLTGEGSRQLTSLINAPSATRSVDVRSSPVWTDRDGGGLVQYCQESVYMSSQRQKKQA